MNSADGGPIDTPSELRMTAPVEFAADAIDQLGAGLSREGDGRDVVERYSLVKESAHETRNQQTGLAASRPSRHQASRSGIGKDLEL
jgi:hypothetical protein